MVLLAPQIWLQIKEYLTRLRFGMQNLGQIAVLTTDIEQRAQKAEENEESVHRSAHGDENSPKN